MNLPENKVQQNISQTQVIEKVLGILTDDFFGALNGLSFEHKKLKILEIYRYFYRFSLDKL